MGAREGAEGRCRSARGSAGSLGSAKGADVSAAARWRTSSAAPAPAESGFRLRLLGKLFRRFDCILFVVVQTQQQRAQLSGRGKPQRKQPVARRRRRRCWWRRRHVPPSRRSSAPFTRVRRTSGPSTPAPPTRPAPSADWWGGRGQRPFGDGYGGCRRCQAHVRDITCQICIIERIDIIILFPGITMAHPWTSPT